VKELDLRLYNSHPPEVLLEQQQKVKQRLPPYHDRVMLEQSHQTGQVPVPRDSRHLLLVVLCGSGGSVIEESEEDVVDFRVDVLGEGLVQHGDEGLLDTRGALGQGVAEETRGDLIEDKREEFGLEADDVGEGHC
jgi:hypothetical protein